MKHLPTILLLNVDIAHQESLQAQLHIRLKMKEIPNSMVIFAVVLVIGSASRMKMGHALSLVSYIISIKLIILVQQK